ILRERFNAHRVLLFGSLVHSGCFTDASDVDVAAEGLDPGDTLLAMDTLHRLDSAIPVNLVDMGACSTSMRDCIEREGVEM
ncbi:MAG: nucleotidyltransferase family protein, partial [Chloroflexota bacterium]